MLYRRLGRSGLKVSEISYGNWLTHANQIDEPTAVACVRAALDAGISTFDTADVYGSGAAEEVLGRALAGVPRESVEICTKVFYETGRGPNDGGLSRKHVMEACHGSLRRLGVDHVDLYQAHRFDAGTPLEETLSAFDDLVRAGKVLYLGVSEWTVEQFTTALRWSTELGLHRIVCSHPQYSMLWRVPEAELIPFCRTEGISQLVWSPLAQGVLTGKYGPAAPAPVDSRATDRVGSSYVRRYLRPEVLQAVQRLGPLAAEAALSPAQLALAWVLREDNVASAVTGASRPEQVTENARAAGVRLAPELLEQIDVVLNDLPQRNPALVG
jgi:aryl-alcohol dehydrogenase-like predicted oxidoreductase